MVGSHHLPGEETDLSSEHPLLTTWKTQRREVIRRIAREPEHFWYWKIRLRVLDYLLSRYSGKTNSLPHPDTIVSGTPPTTTVANTSSTSLDIRDSHRIRELLQRIHSTVGATRK